MELHDQALRVVAVAQIPRCRQVAIGDILAPDAAYIQGTWRRIERADLGVAARPVRDHAAALIEGHTSEEQMFMAGQSLLGQRWSLPGPSFVGFGKFSLSFSDRN